MLPWWKCLYTEIWRDNYLGEEAGGLTGLTSEKVDEDPVKSVGSIPLCTEFVVRTISWENFRQINSGLLTLMDADGTVCISWEQTLTAQHYAVLHVLSLYEQCGHSSLTSFYTVIDNIYNSCLIRTSVIFGILFFSWIILNFKQLWNKFNWEPSVSWTFLKILLWKKLLFHSSRFNTAPMWYEAEHFPGTTWLKWIMIRCVRDYCNSHRQKEYCRDTVTIIMV